MKKLERAPAMLILVVGPSGAGKDGLLDLARRTLADNAKFRFVRRVITRAENAGGEAHEAVSVAEFTARRAANQFALHWQAHGLSYAIPADIADDLATGRAVVANVSRTVLAEARERFPTRIILVTAPVDILAQRLAARGREPAADIFARLTRETAPPTGPDVEIVLNDATLEAGAARFLAALSRAASAAPRC